jgi:hypothetical protein
VLHFPRHLPVTRPTRLTQSKAPDFSMLGRVQTTGRASTTLVERKPLTQPVIALSRQPAKTDKGTVLTFFESVPLDPKKPGGKGWQVFRPRA